MPIACTFALLLAVRFSYTKRLCHILFVLPYAIRTHVPYAMHIVIRLPYAIRLVIRHAHWHKI